MSNMRPQTHSVLCCDCSCPMNRTAGWLMDSNICHPRIIHDGQRFTSWSVFIIRFIATTSGSTRMLSVHSIVHCCSSGLHGACGVQGRNGSCFLFHELAPQLLSFLDRERVNVLEDVLYAMVVLGCNTPQTTFAQAVENCQAHIRVLWMLVSGLVFVQHSSFARASWLLSRLGDLDCGCLLRSLHHAAQFVGQRSCVLLGGR
mmetsp:Transcript_10884/g.30040  ORF Transcript_10884/g.30040 Transcript_10884/m.30040 type:complete len:202 (-) Transcript_10884:101-706(-)